MIDLEPPDVAAALRRAAEILNTYYPEDIFIPPTVESAKTALVALKPIGQTPDCYSAAGARNAAKLLRLWADKGFPYDLGAQHTHDDA